MYNSIEEALTARQDLLERIQSIDTQLAERAAQVATRVSEQEYKAYLEWKARACHAKMSMVIKLQHTKRWIAVERNNIRTARRSNNTMLAELFSLTKSLVSEGASITVDEQQLIDDVGAFLDVQV